jgi:hypothetical protein
MGGGARYVSGALIAETGEEEFAGSTLFRG